MIDIGRISPYLLIGRNVNLIQNLTTTVYPQDRAEHYLSGESGFAARR